MTKLLAGRLKMSEHVRREWTILPELGQSLEDIQQPGFWTHIAKQLTIGDIIAVMPEDGSYWAELLVLEPSVSWARVKLLRHVELQEAAGPSAAVEDERFVIEWKGPAHKYSVLSGTDYVKDGFAERDQAEAWLAEHVRKIAA